jgi:hypothetical protein
MLVTYMDSSSGWATTSSTFRLLLSPCRGGRPDDDDDAGEESIRPRETAHRSTAPAAASIQIQAMDSAAGRRCSTGRPGRDGVLGGLVRPKVQYGPVATHDSPLAYGPGSDLGRSSTPHAPISNV